MVTTKLHTAIDLWNLSSESGRYELIEGELSEVSPSRRRHGIIQARISSRLLIFVESRRLGIVTTEEGYLFDRNPDTVFAPDVAFVSNTNITPEPELWSDVAPDLAVEIVSPNDRPGKIDRKVRIYLENGVRAVWVVYPDHKEVVVHELGASPRTITLTQSLDGGDILPGFTLPLADIFSH